MITLYLIKEDVNSIIDSINSELTAKGLEGIVSTNSSSPQDDILKNNVDYSTIIINYASGPQVSVYFKNTPNNAIIAQDIYKKYGGKYSSSFNQGKYIGVNQIEEK